jgi:hypothetical protein
MTVSSHWPTQCRSAPSATHTPRRGRETRRTKDVSHVGSRWPETFKLHAGQVAWNRVKKPKETGLERTASDKNVVAPSVLSQGALPRAARTRRRDRPTGRAPHSNRSASEQSSAWRPCPVVLCLPPLIGRARRRTSRTGASREQAELHGTTALLGAQIERGSASGHSLASALAPLASVFQWSRYAKARLLGSSLRAQGRGTTGRKRAQHGRLLRSRVLIGHEENTIKS